MANTNRFQHDPDAVIDYTIDWSSWLADGETISASEWDVPTGLTEVSEAETSTETTVRISGGTAGESYTVTNHVATSTGQEDDRSLYLTVRER